MDLTFIVLACHLNVSIPVEDGKNCKEFREVINEEITEMQGLNPYSCMMQSPIMVVKFEENHAGWQVRKWGCKYVKRSQDI